MTITRGDKMRGTLKIEELVHRGSIGKTYVSVCGEDRIEFIEEQAKKRGITEVKVCQELLNDAIDEKMRREA